MWEGMMAFPYRRDELSFHSVVFVISYSKFPQLQRQKRWNHGLYPHVLAVLSFTTLSKQRKAKYSSSQMYRATYYRCVYQPAPRIADRNLCSRMKGEGNRRGGNNLHAMNEEYRQTCVEGKGTLCSLLSRPITVSACLELNSWPPATFRTKTLREVQCS